MGQRKYEKDFSEKLNKRRIEPSAGSWEKLQYQLDSKKEENFVWFKWAGIAAAVIAGIMIIGVFYNDPVNTSPGVVDSPSKENLDITPQIVEEIEGEPLKTETIPGKEKPALILPLKKETSVIAEAEEKKEAPESLEIKTINEGDRDNFSNTEAALTQTTPSEKTGVTDAEIETLLAKARAEIRSQRKSNVVNVNAKDLLWNVEMEMEESFRDKVFDVLKEGFVKAKTAVANRNY